MAEFRNRIAMWQDQAIELHWQAGVHNTFILPTLLFIAQLEAPDAHVVQVAEASLLQIAKGPTAGASSRDILS